jgi:hypothetical protein
VLTTERRTLDDSDLELIEKNKAKYEVDEESRAVGSRRRIVSSDEDDSFSH